MKVRLSRPLQVRLASSPGGRMLLHAVCVLNAGSLRVHAAGSLRELGGLLSRGFRSLLPRR
jgi:hypothetical protein